MQLPVERKAHVKQSNRLRASPLACVAGGETRGERKKASMQLVRQNIVAAAAGIGGAREGGLQRLEVHVRHALRVAPLQFSAQTMQSQ